ncbi:LamG-like jellyroll fold domain-containing protein [uncultured Winogradskyella sp.]|uniref:LamG-like jellyroll fold domain-containing protein n=1 Tax=uncultured Winogradskyella sp. TaxID=395353 RepID=UPI002639CCC4|nr:LamG-like jellyroll fold domain-containing protein [uncultured Winogradskyella sp.]
MKQNIFLVLTLLMTLTVVYSQSSNFLSFDGHNDRVSVNLPITFENIENSSFTIESWVRTQFDNSSVFSTIFFAKKDDDNFVKISTIYNKITFYIEYNGTFVYTASDIHYGDFWPDQWNHVACTWNGTTQEMNIYINGELSTYDYNALGPSSSFGPSDTFSIGFYDFKGDIDELAIWDEERTLTNILDSMDNEILMTEQNLVAYYKFNQGLAGQNNSSETTLADSLNTYPGTLMNFALTGYVSNWMSDEPSLGINHYNMINSINIYPNPSQEYIIITGLNDTQEIDIFNLLGEKVAEYTAINNEKIKIQDLSNGVYFIKFKNRNTIKFIKM